MTEAQTRAFDRGNYCNAYETQDVDAAWDRAAEKLKADRAPEAWLCGFFSSYELHEVPSHWRAALEISRAMFPEVCS